LNLHTPCGASLASDEMRYRSAHPTDYRTSNLTTNFLRANSERLLHAMLAETIRFERTAPFAALRVSSAVP
jgi:hypothetical protein